MTFVQNYTKKKKKIFYFNKDQKLIDENFSGLSLLRVKWDKKIDAAQI